MLDRKRKKFEGFMISYIRTSGLGQFFDPDSLFGETAIAITDSKKRNGTRFLILNGDHFDSLCSLAETGGLASCKEYFRKLPKEHSSWSDVLDE